MDNLGLPEFMWPFLSGTDLKQIKSDLGKFSDNPDEYIEVFRGLT